ncbi:ABC transporter substrate-binding protein [Candidatus Protofrankia californiensis]|uniref:ABC transporter substrate-binding protein n=1 Tax=Candidatus Protofrankia californiensis TaxID=1839754 RepID=UPI0013EB54F7|nr:ABC transporter substrate-binding protein [Candidatus Protofrankia californiensis]
MTGRPDKPSSRRRLRPFVWALSLVLLGAVLAGCASDGPARSASGPVGSASAAPRGTTLRIGDQLKQIELPLELSGAGDGLPYTAKFANFAGGGPEINAAFAAKKIDLATYGDTPVLNALAARTDIVIVGVAAYRPNTQLTVVTDQDGDIRNPADLRGKRIAITKRTAAEGYLLQVLDAAGLTRNDVTIVDVPSTSRLAAVESGDADAAVEAAFSAQTYLALHRGATSLASPVVMRTLLVASQDAISDPARHAAILDLIIRLHRASKWTATHSDAWIDSFFVKQLGLTHETGAAVFTRQGPLTFAAPTDGDRDALELQGGLLTKAGSLPAGLDVARLFDSSFNADLSASLAKG